MRFLKFMFGLLIVAGALRGIYSCFLHTEDENTGQMAIFTLTLMSGAWILKKPWRKVYNFLVIFFLLQLFALKTEHIDYIFGLGISMVQYFRAFTFKPDHLFFSTSYANLSTVHNDERMLIGVNFIALLALITIFYAGKHQKSFQ